MPALVVCVLLASALVYVKPFAATPAALAAMRSDSRVTVSDRLTWYEMTSARRNANGDVPAPTIGLVFTPGARVDPRAYAPLLRPLAAAGYLVIVLKEPFNFALPGTDHAATAMEIHPKVRYWAVGGHSLGGVAAASFADRHPEVIGLLLWASYPAGRLDRQSLKVTSISGTADRLATPAEIAESRADLPKSTQFVVVKGGVHSYFGDYGDQPGDGVPTISRKDAQAQIVRSSAARLGSMVPPRPEEVSRQPGLARVLTGVPTSDARSLGSAHDDHVEAQRPPARAASTVSAGGLELARAKMTAAGVHPQAIDVFSHYYRQLEEGVTGFIAEDSIEPLTDPDLLSDVDVPRADAPRRWPRR